MRFYSNKAFIFILLLIIVLVYSFPKTAEAGWLDDFFDFIGGSFSFIANVVDTVFNVILNTVLGLTEVFVGGVLGVDWLSADGSCRLGNVSGAVLKTYAGECGGDSGNSGSVLPALRH